MAAFFALALRSLSVLAFFFKRFARSSASYAFTFALFSFRTSASIVASLLPGAGRSMSCCSWMDRKCSLSASTDTSPKAVVWATIVNTQNPGRFWYSTGVPFFHSAVCRRWRSFDGMNRGGIWSAGGAAGLPVVFLTPEVFFTRPRHFTGWSTSRLECLAGFFRFFPLDGGSLVSRWRISARLSSSLHTSATSPPLSKMKEINFLSCCRRCSTHRWVTHRRGSWPLSQRSCRAPGSDASRVQYSSA
mmetsp:Transcript_18557/g.41123  ORF Transcript_18557/g.41123 Transcript_18557/m.41123 type:complete len:246 (-) Transcript_18557:751-1488(-)